VSEAEAVPEPFMVGTFALFNTPDGGVHLVLRDGAGTEHHHEVPGFVVALAREGNGLSPAAMIKALTGGRRKSRRALTNDDSRETMGGR
jgi:hypothetical protein